MTYLDAINFIGHSRMFGMKPGLDRMHRLALRLGRPYDRLRFIHIAGTNGKGSTAAFIESCLRASGFRVGLYTSPHLVSIRERIQIDRKEISEESFAEGMEAVRAAMEKDGGADKESTFFEIMTALALWHFEREKADWVVWETGLGGRLDATNIVTPEICVITNVGLDHQQYLGETLREIAEEKAGIIKEGKIVISAVEIGEAAEVIIRRARSERCSLTLVHRDMEVVDLGLRGNQQIAKIDNQEFALGLIGAHQVDNAACAVEVMWQIRTRETDPSSEQSFRDETIARGLASTTWPGRFDIISESPLVVLDGAHNPAGVARLAETWRKFLSAKFGWSESECEGRAHLVFGAVSDKNISEMAALLRPLAKRVSLVRMANERSVEPAKLAEAFTGLPCACYDSVSDLCQQTAPPYCEDLTLVTGSLFLIGEMLARRRGDAEEYRLNERLEKPKR